MICKFAGLDDFLLSHTLSIHDNNGYHEFRSKSVSNFTYYVIHIIMNKIRQSAYC